MLYPIEHWFLASFIAFLFTVFWLIVYRRELLEVIKLELLQDNFVSLIIRLTVTAGTYIIIFLSVNFIGYLLVIFGVNVKQILY